MSSDAVYLVGLKKFQDVKYSRRSRKLRNKLMKKVVGNLIAIRHYHSTFPAKTERTSNYKAIYPGARVGAVRRNTSL